jgi:hypothetical protein
MALSEAEKQQVEAAVNAFVESPNVQATLTNLITSTETTGVAFIDNIINNVKVNGILGGVVNAFKGSAEAEVNALVASLPPAAIASLATKAFEGELKTLLGA